MSETATDPDAKTAVYAPPARFFHWLTAVFVVVMVPVGIYMVNRGAATNFDAVTNTLYSWHKLGGFLLLWIIVARLAYRFAKGAPPDEPTLEPWQRIAAHLNHWSLYALLLAVPLLGWYATSLYGALDVPGFRLPALAGQDQAASERVYALHKAGAILLAALALVHVGAALFHHLIRRDNVFRRMWPGSSPR
jgi:cytochrome b561